MQIEAARPLLTWIPAVAAVAAVGAYWLFRPKYGTARQEAKRRLRLSEKGRHVLGEIMDVEGPLLHYRYQVRGVEYSASQDVSSLLDALPAQLDDLVGPIGVQYDPKNPANSIIFSELWSGWKGAGRAGRSAANGFMESAPVGAGTVQSREKETK